MLGPTPQGVNPVPIVYRDAMARIIRQQRQLRTKFNTILTGGKTGVVGVGIFGTRYGTVRRYATPQAFQNAMEQQTIKNFNKMAQSLSTAIDSLINKAWVRLEQSM